MTKTENDVPRTRADGFEDATTHGLLSPSRPMPLGGPSAGDNRHMSVSIGIVCAAFIFGLIVAPEITVMLIFANVVASWLPVIYGVGINAVSKTPQPSADLPDHDLPHMTILMPLHEEANMLEQIAEMLGAIDYPAALLDCLILLEEDDAATKWQALHTAWPRFARILTVPRGQPQTKARACNYGLHRSFGDIVVVFDAEDMPFPQQLREAAARFNAADDRLACLQAPLIIHTEEGHWRAQQFALEYGVLFTFILPNLSAAMRCLPLGGSSNYFRRRALLRVGGWDEHNLTEDAELALRLAGHGYHMETLNYGTLENAPHEWMIWHRQRTRWQSGHIQILHSYGASIAAHGLAGENGFHWYPVMLAYVAVLSVRLVSGPLLAISLVVLLSPLQLDLPDFMLPIGLGFYALWAVLLWSRCPTDKPLRRLFLVITHPLYWVFTLPAQVNALWRMATGQLSWLKSSHQTYRPKPKEAGTISSKDA